MSEPVVINAPAPPERMSSSSTEGSSDSDYAADADGDVDAGSVHHVHHRQGAPDDEGQYQFAPPVQPMSSAADEVPPLPYSYSTQNPQGTRSIRIMTSDLPPSHAAASSAHTINTGARIKVPAAWQ